MIPVWICLCGTRNRLRELYCLSCGRPNPFTDDETEES
jgi:hypothetical protein